MTSRSLDIYMSHFSALLLSNHRADGRMKVVAFSWSADVWMFSVDFNYVV
jgi:hypothetical protein